MNERSSEEDDYSDDQGELSDPPLRVHHPRRALPTDVVRPTRAEVQLSALRHNLNQLKKAAGKTPVWAVLKADAYGHGSKAVARTLERAGADGVCVALVEEGIELREAGIRLPILVMGGYYGDAFRELLAHKLIPVLSDPGQVEALGRAVHYSDVESFACHIKLDTGMARLGVRASEWPAMVQSLLDRPRLTVGGLMSHLANADVMQEGVFDEPLRLFEAATELFSRAGLAPSLRHIANSAAIIRDPRTHYDLVRPGAALYGVDPTVEAQIDPRDGSCTLTAGASTSTGHSAEAAAPLRLRQTMTIVSRVVSLRTLQKGEAAGYGGTFVARTPTVIATVPMGYADGLSRALSNRGCALVRGKRAPLVGNVSMDMVMLDVTEIAGVSILDEVVFLGAQRGVLGQDQITAQEVAERGGTIAWEVLTNISRRVPRFYREA